MIIPAWSATGNWPTLSTSAVKDASNCCWRTTRFVTSVLLRKDSSVTLPRTMTNCWTGLRIFTILEKSRWKGRRKRRIPKCVICKECTWCEWRCHWNFTKHARFFIQKALIEFKVNCEALVGDDEVQFARETECRLETGDWGSGCARLTKQICP